MSIDTLWFGRCIILTIMSTLDEDCRWKCQQMEDEIRTLSMCHLKLDKGGGYCVMISDMLFWYKLVSAPGCLPNATVDNNHCIPIEFWRCLDISRNVPLSWRCSMNLHRSPFFTNVYKISQVVIYLDTSNETFANAGIA